MSNQQELTLTGYELSTVVNEKLTEVGLDEIPSQMVYNYMKSGRIAFILVDGKKRIELSEAKRFVKEFVQKKRTGSNTRAELLRHFEDEVDEVEEDDLIEVD